MRLHPRVSLDVFIDDSHQSAQGTPREARKLIVAAGRTFTEEAQKQLRVRFADKKTAIVSSHRKMALSVARQLELQKEAVQTQTVGLGGRCERWKNPSRHLNKKEEEDTKSPQEKSQTANADEARGVAGAKDLQMWPAPSCDVRG